MYTYNGIHFVPGRNQHNFGKATILQQEFFKWK